jgi:hypothetical protein
MPTPTKKKNADLEVPELAVTPAAATAEPVANAAAPDVPAPSDDAEPRPQVEDDGPVHRRLIRATLPRPEGQTPERRAPDFTVRQPSTGSGRDNQGSRPPGQRRGRSRRPRGSQQPGQGPGLGNGTPNRQGQGEANGNRAPSAPRGDGRPEGGRGRGPRHGSRKRGE